MADDIDSVEGMIREIRAARFDAPVSALKEWLQENVEYLLGITPDPYATLERIERRYKTQSEILRMVEAGVLDEKLQYVNVGSSDVKEASDVRD